MNSFLISEMFRLELKWEKAEYSEDGICRLIGAYFSGPVLQVAQKLQDPDHMLLDFYSQYIHLVKGTYVGRLDWKGVVYSEDDKIIYLNEAILSHSKELNNVPVLNPQDYFVIDTSDHIIEEHSKNLVYKTYLINSDNTMYRFEK